MKRIETTQAVGHVLCHDLTQIIKGVTKDAIFRKGHVVTQEDIPVLLSIGKDHLYVWEKTEGMLHENDAAQVLYDICKNDHITPSETKEGKIEAIAQCDGLFKVEVELLEKVNALGDMMIATRHTNTAVKKGDKLAGMRVIPLIIEEEKMQEAVKAAQGKQLLSILPFRSKKVGIVTTGNEIYHNRIKDAFGPVLKDKMAEYNAEVLGQTICSDDPAMITKAILKFIEDGAEMVLCTGGMSVDPDDTTPTAIKNTGAEIISYGAPVLPGAMFLLAYLGGTLPIMGLPGCVMYSKRTIFDLVLPRIMAGEKLDVEDLSKLGHGGLCLSCPVCTFPNCGFGK